MFRFKNVGEIPHGVVEQSIGTIPLTKKERDEILAAAAEPED